MPVELQEMRKEASHNSKKMTRRISHFFLARILFFPEKRRAFRGPFLRYVALKKLESHQGSRHFLSELGSRLALTSQLSKISWNGLEVSFHVRCSFLISRKCFHFSPAAWKGGDFAFCVHFQSQSLGLRRRLLPGKQHIRNTEGNGKNCLVKAVRAAKFSLMRMFLSIFATFSCAIFSFVILVHLKALPVSENRDTCHLSRFCFFCVIFHEITRSSSFAQNVIVILSSTCGRTIIARGQANLLFKIRIAWSWRVKKKRIPKK